MGFNTAGRNAMADGLAGAIGFVSVHDAIPDDNGSDELSGGSYARVAVSWNAASSGIADNDAELTHEIPAGATAIAYGFWSLVSGGTYSGHGLVGSSLSGFGAVDSGGVTANTVQSAGHGLSNGDRVAVYNVLAESLPAGLSEQTLYWVVGVTTDTFQLSTSEGGSAVDITGQGELWWQNAVPETFGSAGQLVTAAGDLDINTNVV